MGFLSQLILILSFAHATGAFAEPALVNAARRAWVGAAELAHTAKSGGCDAIDEAEAQKALAHERACDQDIHQASFASVGQVAKHLQESSEDGFFGALARRHANELKCGADFATRAAGNEGEALANIGDKVRAMREARQDWIKAVKDLHASGPSANRLCPTTSGELDRSAYADTKHNEVCERQIKAYAAFVMARNSIPLVGESHVAAFAKTYAERAEDLSPADLSAALKQAYVASSAELRRQSEALKTRAQQKGGADFGIEERRTLLSDPRVTAGVVSTNPSALKNVFCRADARFGQGAELRDSTLAIGTLVFGGEAQILRGVAGVARAAGQLSLNAARVLEAGAALTTLGAATAEASKACFALPVKASGGGDACVSAPKIEQLTSDTCALGASLSGLDAAGVLPGTALAKFFAFGGGVKKVARGAEALREAEQVGFRTSSGKARVGEVLQVSKNADGNVEAALVKWQDPNTGEFKRKIMSADELSRNATPMKALPLKGDPAVDDFRRGFNDSVFTAENRYISYVDPSLGRKRAAHVVGRRGDALEVEVLTDSKIERKILSPEELNGARIGTAAAGPEFFAGYNQKLFAGQPSYAAPAGRSQNQRVFNDGSGPRRVDVINDHAYRQTTLARGDIVEHHQPGRLAPGEYTYAVLEDGSVVTGRVHDNFEFGVKHSHLADGRRVLVAGELKVPEGQPKFDFNIESGTYTRELIERYGLKPEDLTEKAKRALSFMLGEEGQATTRTFWNARSPDARTVRAYCGDRTFRGLNFSLCDGGAALAH